ncbi:MAG TPA: hypothetical protein VFI29_13750 [Hanamia sp.]|nr:hypothetical protein [Hanamia sp.]
MMNLIGKGLPTFEGLATLVAIFKWCLFLCQQPRFTHWLAFNEFSAGTKLQLSNE